MEQVIRNGGFTRESSASHFFHVLVHCTLRESVDYNDPSLEFFKSLSLNNLLDREGLVGKEGLFGTLKDTNESICIFT